LEGRSFSNGVGAVLGRSEGFSTGDTNAPFRTLPFQNLELLLAIPEYKVNLLGGRRPSQNDIFVLGKAGADLVSIMIEGKVDECFDKTIGKWLSSDSAGKRKRLTYLREQLELADIPPTIRYQLVHRTASAIVEARRFNAKAALMIVHSFNQDRLRFDDYENFLTLFGVKAEHGKLMQVRQIGDIDLYCGWATGNPRFLKDLHDRHKDSIGVDSLTSPQ
jgi:hypothetical protein